MKIFNENASTAKNVRITHLGGFPILVEVRNFIYQIEYESLLQLESQSLFEVIEYDAQDYLTEENVRNYDLQYEMMIEGLLGTIGSKLGQVGSGLAAGWKALDQPDGDLKQAYQTGKQAYAEKGLSNDVINRINTEVREFVKKAVDGIKQDKYSHIRGSVSKKIMDQDVYSLNIRTDSGQTFNLKIRLAGLVTPGQPGSRSGELKIPPTQPGQSPPTASAPVTA